MSLGVAMKYTEYTETLHDIWSTAWLQVAALAKQALSWTVHKEIDNAFFFMGFCGR